MKTIKHTYIKLIPIACLLITCFNGCKKFPEDKFISFRTVKQRLEGEWQLNKITIDGNDVGSVYNDSLPQSYDSFRFWFLYKQPVKPHDHETADYFIINTSSKKSHDAFINMDVGNILFGFGKKDGLSIFGKRVVNDSLSFKPLANLFSTYYIATNWQIKKLYKKQLVIEKDKDGKHYRLQLNKTRNELF